MHWNQCIILVLSNFLHFQSEWKLGRATAKKNLLFLRSENLRTFWEYDEVGQ